MLQDLYKRIVILSTSTELPLVACNLRYRLCKTRASSGAVYSFRQRNKIFSLKNSGTFFSACGLSRSMKSGGDRNLMDNSVAEVLYTLKLFNSLTVYMRNCPRIHCQFFMKRPLHE